MMRTRSLLPILLAVGVTVWLLTDLLGTSERAARPGAGGDIEHESEERDALPLLVGTGRSATTPVTELAYRLKGKVLGEDGSPAAGVRVVAREAGTRSWIPDDPTTWGNSSVHAFARNVARVEGGEPERARAGEDETDESGRFEIAVAEPRSYSLVALVEPPLASSRATAWVNRDRREDESVIRIVAGHALTGRVVDAGGAGVDAFVSGRGKSQDEKLSFVGESVRTALPDGAFAFPALGAGDWKFDVTLPGRMVLRGYEAEIPHDGELVLRIGDRAGTLRGTVSTPEGTPVPGAQVIVEVSTTDRDARTLCLAKAGADGAYRMEAVPTGEVASLQVLAAGFVLLDESPPLARWSGAEVRQGAETVLDATLVRGAVVVGRTLEEKTLKPIPGVQVLLSMRLPERQNYAPHAAVSGEDGSFRLEGVPPGRGVVLAQAREHYMPALESVHGNGVVYSPDGLPLNSVPKEVLLVIGEQEEEIRRDVVLRPGLVVRGRVLAADGSPAAGADVRSDTQGIDQLSWQWGFQWYGGDRPLAQTDGSGRFEARGLPPSEAMVLTANRTPEVGVPCDAFPLRRGEDVPEVTLRLEQGASLSGRVIVAETREAVAGAGVNVWTQGARRLAGPSYVRADDEGRFEVQGIPPGPLTLYVNSDSHPHRQLALDPFTAGEERKDVVVELYGGVRVSGVLVDEEGEPLPRQSLALRNESRSAQLNTSTGADGSFSFENAPEGACVLIVYEFRGGYGQEVELEGGRITAPAEGLRIVMRKKPKTVLEGTVLDAAGKPIPLCRVTIRGSGAGGVRNAFYGGADPDEVANGHFRREVEGTAPFTLTVSQARNAQGELLNLREATRTVKAEETTGVIEIRLETGLEIAGRVRDEADHGVSGVRVTSGRSIAETDDDGRFRLSGLGDVEAVALDVRVPPGWVKPRTVSTRPGAEDLVILLRPALAIAGRIVDAAGSPVSQAQVTAKWPAGSDHEAGEAGPQGGLRADGSFVIEGLPPQAVATVHVRPWSQGEGGGSAPASVEGVGAGTTDLVVTLGAGVSIDGHAVDAEGQPVADGWVMARPIEGDDSNAMGYSLEAGGKFHIGGLEPGRYKLTAQRRDGRQRSEPLEVDAPASGVRLVFPRTAEIRGRLVGDGDLTGFRIRARSIAEDAASASAQTRADGTFTLSGLADGGAYRLQASKPEDDRYALLARATPGAGPVELRLSRGESLSGTVAGTDGNPPSVGCWVMAAGQGFSTYARVDPNGGFRLRGLPPGTYKLRLNAQGRSTSTEETEASTGATNVHLTLK